MRPCGARQCAVVFRIFSTASGSSGLPPGGGAMLGSPFPRSSLRPPLAAGGSSLSFLVLTEKVDVYENLGVFALPHEL